MKIMVVHLNNIVLCPPAINVVENLVDHGHEVTLVSYNISEMRSWATTRDNFSFFDIGSYEIMNASVKKYFNRYKDRKKARGYIRNHISEYDRVWTTSEITVRDIGDILLTSGVKHIMQLMELTDYVPRIGNIKAFSFDIKKYAQHAYKVVVPEVNRAHIVKVKWELNDLPEVLPNKPYTITIDEENISSDAEHIIERLKSEKRKVILYQGGFTKDRKFDQFAQAIGELGGSYVLCLMGKDNNYRKQICDEYKSIVYLGFLQPPEHLIIAKYAHIGILTYRPIQDAFYSDLNAVYCAPNKTFEYALCGLPMIGTNVPGLNEIFDKYEVGCSIKRDDVESVKEAITFVERKYDQMRNNCFNYFESVDLNALVAEIIR